MEILKYNNNEFCLKNILKICAYISVSTTTKLKKHKFLLLNNNKNQFIVIYHYFFIIELRNVS